ncbi:MAG: histidine--tRNA ligase [Chitinophagaceae bacterium]
MTKFTAMAKKTVSLPQGTRDFGPEEVWKRTYLLQTIKSVFERYGFQPLETPALENLETLLGKYGEEGDRLIFKILNNGLYEPSKQSKARQALENIFNGKSDPELTERALKYDLTIPFARYVAMNHNQLTLPFKRYQIQPVWRADRPQKGRYREFWQCDADVVGSTSLLNEIELANIYHEVFTHLRITGYALRVNSRKILSALATYCGKPQELMALTTAIDKLDKVGLEKVKEELNQRGFDQKQIKLIGDYLNIQGSNEQKITQLRTLFAALPEALEGLKEMEQFLQSGLLNRNLSIALDLTLARGLNYYTGIIFEAKAPEQVQIGSIGGGGRYDDLTGLFGVPNLPGVGISFGLDRIYDVMETMGLFPPSVASGTQFLFFNTGAEELTSSYQLMQAFRGKGLACELYADAVKFDKQFKYAERKNIPYVVIIGSEERQKACFLLKKLQTGHQQSWPMAVLDQEKPWQEFLQSL